jgi:hypothetical protein
MYAQCDQFKVEGAPLTSAWNRLHEIALVIIHYERSKDPETALEDIVYEEVSRALDVCLAEPR